MGEQSISGQPEMTIEEAREFQAQVDQYKSKIDSARSEISKVIFGQTDMVDNTLISVFAGGHVLLEGMPGLAKTLFANTLSRVLGIGHGRVQCTPDLMPSDILGTEILVEVEGEDGKSKKKFEFLKGPIFNQQVLVDEINRASPRTQSALLQAMQEYEVTIGDETRKLPEPFFVIATQNPVDQAGTNSLPEAQLDRFLMKIGLSYPNLRDEMKIATYDFSNAPKAQQVLTPEEIIEISALIKKVMMPENVAEFAVRLAMATRPGEEYTKVESKDVKHGAGPRASQAMMKCAQAKAFMDGRLTITIDDVKAVSKQILGHRISLEYGVTTPLSEFLDKIIEAVDAERPTWDPTLATAKAAPAAPAPA